MIQAEALTKRYGDATVVDGLSFRAAPGQVTGLIGANGAGKTTTLRLLLGLSRPTAGRAWIDGRDRIGYAPAEQVGPPGRRGRAQIELLAALSRLPRGDAQRALERVGMETAAQRRIGAYSTGMQRRLALAIAMQGDPPAVILDEPTNGMDPLVAHDTWRQLRSLAHEQGSAVLVASHALAEMLACCDHIVVLRAGRAAFTGPVTDLGSGAGRSARALALLGGAELR